jgi:hypothetical protein
VIKVTFRRDKVTRKPLGQVYVEFEEREEAVIAIELSGTLLKNRQVTILPKRKNLPHMGKPRQAHPMAMMTQFMTHVIRGSMYRGRGGFRGRGGRGGAAPTRTFK